MHTKIYWIHDFNNDGRLGIMPRPRGNDWLEEEIVHLKKQRVDVWVSLLESHESQELGLRNQQSLSNKYEFEFINYSIVDRSVPDKSQKIELLIERVHQFVLNGRSVVIHCRMGIGRSSVIAGAVLIKEGFKTDLIIQKITMVRGLKVPDTEEQVQWLKDQEQKIDGKNKASYKEALLD